VPAQAAVVLVTMTGAPEGAATAGLLGTRYSAAVSVRKPSAITICLARFLSFCLMAFLLIFKSSTGDNCRQMCAVSLKATAAAPKCRVSGAISIWAWTVCGVRLGADPSRNRIVVPAAKFAFVRTK
jgi:hypothetical protein